MVSVQVATLEAPLEIVSDWLRTVCPPTLQHVREPLFHLARGRTLRRLCEERVNSSFRSIAHRSHYSYRCHSIINCSQATLDRIVLGECECTSISETAVLGDTTYMTLTRSASLLIQLGGDRQNGPAKQRSGIMAELFLCRTLMDPHLRRPAPRISGGLKTCRQIVRSSRLIPLSLYSDRSTRLKEKHTQNQSSGTKRRSGERDLKLLSALTERAYKFTMYVRSSRGQDVS